MPQSFIPEHFYGKGYNHPGDYDYLFLEFRHFRLYPDAVPQMVGIENYNGTDGFDQYYYSGS